MLYRHSRAIRRAASDGSFQALDRPTLVTAFTVNAVNADCIVNLRDGGATGPIYWTLEADNAASSAVQTFDIPLKFFNKVYMEFVVSGTQSSASIAVVEP